MYLKSKFSLYHPVFNLRIFLFLCFCLSHKAAHAQKDPYSVFRKALAELITEHGKTLPQLDDDYKRTLKALEPYKLTEPVGILTWGSEEERKELFEQITFISEQPGKPKKDEDQELMLAFIGVDEAVVEGEDDKPNPLIEYTSTPMFPDEPTGYRLIPNYSNPQKPDCLLWKSASMWLDTSAYYVANEPDPELKKKREAIADHQAALQAINNLGLMSGLYACSNSWSEFDDMMDFLELQGYHLSTFYFGFKNYTEYDLVRDMKGSIIQLVSNITRSL